MWREFAYALTVPIHWPIAGSILREWDVHQWQLWMTSCSFETSSATLETDLSVVSSHSALMMRVAPRALSLWNSAFYAWRKQDHLADIIINSLVISLTRENAQQLFLLYFEHPLKNIVTYQNKDIWVPTKPPSKSKKCYIYANERWT